MDDIFLPCPYCGSRDIRMLSEGVQIPKYYCRCDVCRAASQRSMFPEQARYYWNRRVENETRLKNGISSREWIKAEAFAKQIDRLAENYRKTHDSRGLETEYGLFADGMEFAADLAREMAEDEKERENDV